ncbi:MAG: LD-carboxypeptidase [Geodermatophilaceae bacterium]|jgi:muramoyltetrapeptide carboxypeptidase LdcA involved in peptidoglycan recycling|nr:LD-carboxypeptidase [Geodermatophilaceae bacterium]
MTIRYPAPLRPGDRIGITAPSSGVPDDLRTRLEVCIDHLRQRGYQVVVGDCMDGETAVSAPAHSRAAELTAMLTDPDIKAVVPPWGGELAVELLPHLDLAAIAASDPTWLVGYSDLSTILLPMTTVTGIATVHAQNLMDTPYRIAEPLRSWLDVVTLPPGASFSQAAAAHHRSSGHDSWQDNPTVEEYTLDASGTWSLLQPAGGDIQVQGRLIGGCTETISVLAGTTYGDLRAFAADHAPEGLIVYVEAAENGAFTIARDLWRMRLAGWFDHADAVLVGRTNAPDVPGFSQHDAVRSALAELDVPVVVNVDFGHVPPQLALINGALTDLTVTDATKTITQHLR